MRLFGKPLAIPTAGNTLPGRETRMPVVGNHHALDTGIAAPFPDGTEQAMFGLGCFWGAERMFWRLPGVHTTAVGYAGGSTPNPTYDEVCSGQTGHNEVVLVVFSPDRIAYSELLRTFWEGHDPTQGMRQGNDRGTQYRSGIYCFGDAQLEAATRSRDAFQPMLTTSGYGPITTEIIPAPPFYYAEGYHQQYLSKEPNGYCGLGGTGVVCPIGVAATT